MNLCASASFVRADPANMNRKMAYSLYGFSLQDLFRGNHLRT
jgi:hypothetical protein